jgi:Xaa-Pro aminopeptidase
MFDLARFTAPPMITAEEVRTKLDHLAGVLGRSGRGAILLSREGAMRWLTGIRHQITDLAPDAESPVKALVSAGSSSTQIVLFTTRIEMPRVRDQVPETFKGVSGVTLDFQEGPPPSGDGIFGPGQEGYDTALGEIVRPLTGGFEGNQFQKLEWLCSMTTAVLIESAHQLQAGMNGAQVRGLIFRNLAERDIECNLILVALAGQEKHYHPLYNSRYKLENGCWVKLVAGSRYAEHIVSATAMVRYGGRISPEEARIYAALQEGAMEYADLFRSGAIEADIHREVGARFIEVEKKRGLRGFGPSAYFHHMGGPTSPIGNRDFLIDPNGVRRMFPWMQFAINPVDVFQSTKVEMQGIVQPTGAPHILDGFRFTPPERDVYTEVRVKGGASGKVANLVHVRR